MSIIILIQIISGGNSKQNMVLYETKYLDTIVLIETSAVVEQDEAVVRGKLYNAITGTAVSGATVKIRSGWNRKDGEYVTTWYGKEISQVCDQNGEFELSMPMGQYTIEVSCEGYITGYFNVVTGMVSNVSKQSFVLTPILSSDEYRIVLTWGASLSDLDDVTGYGPETVTLTVDVGEIGEGVFRYSVHDFSSGSSVSSTRLSYSNAVVRVYNGNELVETYVVPQNEKGTVWPVFSLSKDGLQSANETFYSASASGVR